MYLHGKHVIVASETAFVSRDYTIEFQHPFEGYVFSVRSVETGQLLYAVQSWDARAAFRCAFGDFRRATKYARQEMHVCAMMDAASQARPYSTIETRETCNWRFVYFDTLCLFVY